LPIVTGETGLSIKNQTVTVRSGALPGQIVVIEASDDLHTWNTLGAAQADSAGNVNFKESAGAPKRFYRVIPQ